MGEKLNSSSSNFIEEASPQACFNGCCAKPLFHRLANDSSQSHSNSTHSPKSTKCSSQHNFVLSTLTSLHPNSNTTFTNHESLPSLHESYSYFIKSFPQFSHTQQADQIRSREYYHLALSNHVCLDYVGYGLFSHSSKPTNNASSSSTSYDHFSEPSFFDIRYKPAILTPQLLLCELRDQYSELEVNIRKKIMSFMNVSEEDYTMVFTSNQSSAFKLVADSYPFHSHRNLLTVYDYNAEALEIMTESSKRRGARVSSAGFSWPSMRIQSRNLRKIITTSKTKKVKTTTMKNKGLFVFPLQSRMTGSRYSYQWMSVARENGWHVLLDACALGPKEMETLGLSLFKPDFLICSFYKIFGEDPSGFGCLFIKKSSSSILLSDFNASTSIGIVNLVPPPSSSSSISSTSSTQTLLLLHNLEAKESFDNKSTLIGESPNNKDSSYSEIVELDKSTSASASTSTSSNTIIKCNGLDHADSLGLVVISARSRFLINWLLNALTKLQHPYSESGNPLVRIYGPKIGFDRGPSLAFNVFDWKGEKIDPILVQKLADRNNIALSFGFLKHVCFVDKSQEDKERRVETVVSSSTTRAIMSSDHKEREYYGQCQSGFCVISATLGLVTNFEDVYRLWAFIARFLDADFVEKEKWRYLALNQTTIEV